MNFVDTIRSWRPLWRLITLTAEPTLLIPLGLLIFGWLWLSCSRRTALWFGGLWVLGASLLVLQKLLYYAFGISLASIRLFSISGHSYMASYLYGSLVVILCASWRRANRYIAYAGVLLLVLLVGVSRVAMFGHRMSEAIVGLLIGTALLFVFLRKGWRPAHARFPAWTLAVPAVVLFVALYGHVYEFETIFRRIGRSVRPDAIFYR